MARDRIDDERVSYRIRIKVPLFVVVADCETETGGERRYLT